MINTAPFACIHVASTSLVRPTSAAIRFAVRLAGLAMVVLAPLVGAGAASAAGRSAASGQPNILFLLAEDIGPELGCYPENWASALVRTPNIDRLAREGMRFTHCFATAPVCSASRSALMTGMYPTTIGAHNHRTWPWNKQPLPDGVLTITDYFRKAGYFTANLAPEKLPVDPRTGQRGETGAQGSGKTDLNFLVERPFDGRDWKQRAEGQPFFAQLTIQESHKGIGWIIARENRERVPHPVDPADIPVPPYYPDHRIVREEMANYLDAIMLLDSYVGDVLAQLEREGLLDSTIIVFMGDNGQCLARGKQFLYDEGTHVPLVIRWPDRRDAGTVSDEFVEGIDVSAMLLGLAGIRPNATMQGRNFLDPSVPPREHVFTARDRMDETTDRMRAVRTRRWKYIRNFFPALPYMQYNNYKMRDYPTWNLILAMKAAGTLDPVQALFAADRKPIEKLYDLEADPHEVNNLAADPKHAAVLERLRGLVDEWIVETGDRGAVMEDPLDIYRGYWGHLPNEAPVQRPNYERQ